MAPALVVPALATTATGSGPLPASASRWRRSSSGSMRPMRSAGTATTASRPMPSTAAARRTQRHQVGHRAAAAVQALHAGRQVEQLGQPLERQLLEEVEGGQAEPLGRGDRAGQGRQRADRGGAGGDEGGRARVRDLRAVGNEVAAHLVHHGGDAHTLPRQRPVERGAPAVRLAHRIRMLELEVAVEIATDLREPSAEVSAFRAVTDVHGPPPSVPIGCPARAYASTCTPSARKAMVRGAPAISTPSARSVAVMPLALAQAGHSQILPPLARYAAIRSASGS